MKYFFSFILCILLSSSLSANDNTKLFANMSLEELLKVKVRVSTSKDIDIINSPSVVSVIDKDMIKKYNFLTLSEAVRVVAGVDILQSNLDRNIPTFRGIMQNYYANKVLILINNIPTWQVIYGNGSLDRIHINDVERIEILKGPASVLYGTNAFNGVINIITKLEDENSVDALARFGYPGYTELSASLNYVVDDLKLNFSINNTTEKRSPYRRTLANDPIPGGPEERVDTNIYFKEDYQYSSINLNSKYKSSNFFINYYESDYTFPGINISFASGSGSLFSDKGLLMAYQMRDQELYEDFTTDLQLYYDYSYRNFIVNVDQSRAVKYSTDKLGGFVKAHYKIHDNVNFELGSDFINGFNRGHHFIDVLQDTILNQNMEDDIDLMEYSVFAQSQIDYSIFSLFLGSRYTMNDVFDHNLSSRATLNTKFDENNSIKIIIGESFRTPNMLELYFNHPTVIGNPDLKPELSTSYEFQYTRNNGNFLYQVTLFYNSYSDLIQRIRPDVTKPAIYRNLASFGAYGIETELKYLNSEIINAFINYNYVAGEDSDDAYSNFRFAPEHTLAFGLCKEYGNFCISTNGYLYSKTEALIEDIPIQFMLDFHLAYKHKFDDNINLNHTLSVTNITNSDMLIPEYNRRRENINSIPTTAFGSRVIYTLRIATF